VFKFLWNLDDGKSVRSCVAYLTKNFARLSSCRYWADRAQNLPGPAPGNVFRVLQVSSKSVHFRQSYSVNTAKTCRIVNPIFGWSLASSRIISSHCCCGFYPSVLVIDAMQELCSKQHSSAQKSLIIRRMCRWKFSCSINTAVGLRWRHGRTFHVDQVCTATALVLCILLFMISASTEMLKCWTVCF